MVLRLLAIVAVLASAAPAWADSAPRAEEGVLDLTEYDLKASQVVELAGEWAFARGALLTPAGAETAATAAIAVPGSWTGQIVGGAPMPGFAFGTYILTVKLPPSVRRPSELAIDVGEPLSAWRLFVNGRQLGVSGRPGDSVVTEEARSIGGVFQIPGAGGELRIVLQVSNFANREGGLGLAPRLGDAPVLSAGKSWKTGLALGFIGALLVMGAYHLTFLVRQTDGLGQAAFGAFSILVGLRAVFADRIWVFIWPDADQVWMWRVEHVCTYLILPAAFAFVAFSFPKELRWRWTGVAICAVCGAAAAAALVLPMPRASDVMNAFQAFAVAAILLLFGQLALAMRRGRPGAGLSLLGWAGGGAAAIVDILHDNGLASVGGLLPVGFLFFLLTQSVMLGMRFRRAITASSELSESLRALNRSLEEQVERRTADLSEKVRLLTERETELDEARKAAEAANEAKSRFLATMSHELRTPLNAVLGFSELIGQQAFGPVGDKRYVEYAHLIHSGGAHLLALINDILDLSKVEAGRRDLECEDVSVQDLIATAHALTAGRAEERGVRLAFQRNAALVLHADRRACLQMLVNLLANAIKFTERGGTVSLAAHARADGGAGLAVADTGIGMDPDEIPRALEAFSQLDSGHARRHEGTGLGLAIVQALIRLHGGALAIESAKGKGTTVTLAFPPARVRGRMSAA